VSRSPASFALTLATALSLGALSTASIAEDMPANDGKEKC
jgi:uncharacterized membrane protein